MRILFLSAWFPYPPSNGSKLRIYNLLRALARNHELTLVSLAEEPGLESEAAALRTICARVEVVPWTWRPFQPHSWRARLGFLSRTPRWLLDTFSREMDRRIRRLLATSSFDVVVASQLISASYARCFRGLPALFEEVEIGVLYDQFAHARSTWPRLRSGLTWIKHQHYLSRLLPNFRACTVVSERERQLLRRAVPNYTAVEVIPNAIAVADYADVHPIPHPKTLIFTGSFRYVPNYDAMVWFVREVFPRIRAHAPDVHLVITGDAGDRVLPPTANVLLAGFVDDVRPMIASSWASVVPIRMGGGTRLKILEAMTLGTPVIATSKGAEGLEVVHGRHLLIADEPTTFAQHVLDVLSKPDLRRELADNARRLVEERYDWRVIGPRFAELVGRVAR